MRRSRLSKKILGAAVAAAALALTVPGAQAAQTVIKTLKQPLIYYAPFVVAAAEGFDAQENIKSEFVPISDGAQLASAILNGVMDVSPCSFDAIANLADRGKHLIAVYQLVDRVTLDLVVGKNILKSGVTASSPLSERFAVLKGHRFGITDPSGPSDIFLHALLQEAHLDPRKDVEIIRVGSIAGMSAALKSGQIDGYMLSPPSPQQVEASGAGKVLIRPRNGELKSLPSFSFLNLCTTAEFAKTHGDLLRAYLRAVQKGNDWMRKNKDETLKIFNKQFPNVPVGIWEQAYDNLLPSVSTDGRFDPKVVKTSYETYKKVGVTQSVPDLTEGVTWTNSFLPAH